MNLPEHPRARFYRISLLSAAAYNGAFAAWTILRPRAFFDLLGMEAPRYPSIWQCLGMVVGVYGLGYAYAAWRLDRGRPLVALGLLGKLLGPIGWVATVHSGEWPIRTFTLVLFNDLVWWLPFGLYLTEGTRAGARLRSLAPQICAALNFLAALAMPLLLAPGMETVRDAASRLAYIEGHPVLWRAGWGFWIAAALSLIGFYVWWASRVRSRSLGFAALVLATAGLAGDLLAESLYIGWLPADYDRIAILARLLTGAWGNTLYTVAGILLTIGSPWLRGPARAVAWLIWIAGLALGAFSVAGHVPGMVVSTALLCTLFCPWVAWMGVLDRRKTS